MVNSDSGGSGDEGVGSLLVQQLWQVDHSGISSKGLDVGYMGTLHSHNFPANFTLF